MKEIEHAADNMFRASDQNLHRDLTVADGDS